MKPSIYVSLFSLLSSALVGCNVVLDLPPAFSETAGAAGESGGGASNTGGSKNKGGTSSGGSSSTKNTSKPTGGASATGGASSTDTSTTGGVTSTGGTSASTGGTSSTGGTTTVGSPVISSFTVDYNKVCSGNTATLKAVFSNGTGTVSGGVGTVTSGVDKVTGAITANTTYTLAVTNSQGEKVESTVTITALKSGDFTPTGAPHGGLRYQDGYATQGTNLPNGTPVVLTDGSLGVQQVELYDLNSGEFKLTGAVSRPINYGSFAPIDNSRILFASGLEATGGETTRAEIFELDTGKTIATSNLSTGREDPLAVYLPTVKKVLITGGTNNGETAQWDTAELFDPSQGTNGAFSRISMQIGRAWHTTTVMPDGRVLLAGSADWIENASKTAEIYDPNAGPLGSFTLTGSLKSLRTTHAAVALADGRVLIAGGTGPTNTAEIFDPATGNFTPTGNMKTGRSWFSMVLMGNGKVFVFGGGSSLYEIFNPGTGEFSYSLANPNVYTGLALPLKNGAVLVTGSKSGVVVADIFCP